MAYSSYNEYIVQNNLLVLVAIYAANYFASNDVPLFGFFLKFKIVKLLGNFASSTSYYAYINVIL